MGDTWRQEKRGDFGWSVEGSSDIKAFWLSHVDFADPNTEVIGKISDATAKVLVRKIAEHAGEITPGPRLVHALQSGLLEGFKVSDELGGGCRIVLTAGLINFLTLAKEKTLPKHVDYDKQETKVTNCSHLSSAEVPFLSKLTSWFYRVFSFSKTAKLAARLASDDESIFIPALTEAVTYAPKGNELGVRAMEEAMRRRAFRRDLIFMEVHLGGLKTRNLKTANEAPKVLVELARDQALLRNPYVSQDLMSACITYHGYEGCQDCLLEIEELVIKELVSKEQFYIFQLLYNHITQSAKLARARGERTWEEQMSKEGS